jgi:uncharacterized MAPEG superfamily protein
MTPDLHYLAYSALLTWLMLMTGSMLRNKLWTPTGLVQGVGNRDIVVQPLPIAGRADRAAANMLENLVLFTVVVLVARSGGVPPEKIVPGAMVFFWARVAYFAVYLAGIPWLRTVVWAVGVAGMGMIAMAAH